MRDSKKIAKKTTRESVEPLEMYEGSDNVFKDIGFSDAEAQSLLIRSTLMIEIERIVRANGWTQAKAAKILGITQPRVSEIMSDHVDLFTVDTLIKYLSMLGREVSVNVTERGAA
jgi:predicted XRE-type DNA-binding protein